MQALIEPVESAAPRASLPEPMTVEYQLGIDDVMALHADNTRTYMRASLRKMALTLLLLLGLSIPILIQTLDSQFIEMWVLIAVCVPVWAFIFVRILKKRQQAVRKHIEDGKNRQLHGTRRLTISESGVQEETPFTMSRSAWHVIERILETSSHIYICVGNLTVYMIPKCAFASDAAGRRFISAAKTFHAAIARGTCKKCGYDLLGNSSGRCPECGTAVSLPPADGSPGKSAARQCPTA